STSGRDCGPMLRIATPSSTCEGYRAWRAPADGDTNLRAMSPDVLRIGVLGAAKIAPMALIRPAREVAGVEVAAIAARDPARAEQFAKKHGVPRVHQSYAELLADDAIDVIYNPLPNGLHAEWSIRALEAGKHVLCEKPIASNAAEAEQMA